MTQSRPSALTKFTDLFSFSSSEVAHAFKHARRTASISGLKLLYVSPDKLNEPRSHGKLLIITPRICGKAHDRNKIRRRIKSIYYQHKLYTTPGVFILLVYRHAMSLSYDQLKEFLLSSISSNNAH